MGDDEEEVGPGAELRSFRGLTVARALIMIEVRGGAVW